MPACVLAMTEEGQRALGGFLIALLETPVANREMAAEYVCSLLQERLDDQRYFDPPDAPATPAQRQRVAESQDLSPVFEDLSPVQIGASGPKPPIYQPRLNLSLI